ncbi:transposase [Candidatus Poriferisodalis sp.]|uniref:transposase n=1 Tax=Candidatus Poriferisodalis sp. TaxID=3101277 RepID=UPI003B013061
MRFVFRHVGAPIVDDSTVETIESFSIEIAYLTGTPAADTTATATIVDNDGTVLGLPSVAPCDGIVLSGRVAGVFDIAQSGYASDSHAFVDIDVTCGSPSGAVGLPAGVGVVSGPASSLGASSHCITRVGTQRLTRSTGAGQGCVTYTVTRSISGYTAGRSTHIVRIPDSSIGRMHQLLVWVDADRDRTYDAGIEPGMTTAEHGELVALRKRVRELETELAIHRRATELGKRDVGPKGSSRPYRAPHPRGQGLLRCGARHLQPPRRGLDPPTPGPPRRWPPTPWKWRSRAATPPPTRPSPRSDHRTRIHETQGPPEPPPLPG